MSVRQNVPSAVAKIRAVLSVLPAMIYSPVGLHARSYTCIVVQLIVSASVRLYRQWLRYPPKCRSWLPVFFLMLQIFRIEITAISHRRRTCGWRPYYDHSVWRYEVYDDQAKKIAYHLLQTRLPRLEKIAFSNLIRDDLKIYYHLERSAQR